MLYPRMAIAFGHKVEITSGKLSGRRGNIVNHTANRADVRLDSGERVEDVPLEALKGVRGRPFRTMPEWTESIAFA